MDMFQMIIARTALLSLMGFAFLVVGGMGFGLLTTTGPDDMPKAWKWATGSSLVVTLVSGAAMLTMQILEKT